MNSTNTFEESNPLLRFGSIDIIFDLLEGIIYYILFLKYLKNKFYK
jgi:hypothetical protein